LPAQGASAHGRERAARDGVPAAAHGATWRASVAQHAQESPGGADPSLAPAPAAHGHNFGALVIRQSAPPLPRGGGVIQLQGGSDDEKETDEGKQKDGGQESRTRALKRKRAGKEKVSDEGSSTSTSSTTTGSTNTSATPAFGAAVMEQFGAAETTFLRRLRKVRRERIDQSVKDINEYTGASGQEPLLKGLSAPAALLALAESRPRRKALPVHGGVNLRPSGFAKGKVRKPTPINPPQLFVKINPQDYGVPLRNKLESESGGATERERRQSVGTQLSQPLQTLNPASGSSAGQTTLGVSMLQHVVEPFRGPGVMTNNAAGWSLVKAGQATTGDMITPSGKFAPMTISGATKPNATQRRKQFQRFGNTAAQLINFAATQPATDTSELNELGRALAQFHGDPKNAKHARRVRRQGRRFLRRFHGEEEVGSASESESEELPALNLWANRGNTASTEAALNADDPGSEEEETTGGVSKAEVRRMKTMAKEAKRLGGATNVIKSGTKRTRRPPQRTNLGVEPKRKRRKKK
jgi:hypothetical protein